MTRHRRRMLLVLLIAGAAALALMPARTPAIRDGNGRAVSGSIATLEKVRLGSVDQWILVRGRNRQNPVLLFLHGGPGMPSMYLAHAFQRELENDFVVVQWDRRGAGKSYNANVPPDSLTTEQIIADTLELIASLRTRLRQDKIFLVAHSWATYPGMLLVQRHPELFHAYVGIGQLADTGRIRAIQDRFILQRARATQNRDAEEFIHSNASTSRESWIFKFGGELHSATNWTPLLWAGLMAPEYSLIDTVYRLPAGLRSYSRNFRDSDHDPMAVVRAVSVPTYFFTGRYDYTDPAELTQKYYELLQAPRKEMIWFDDSAHFAFFEEPSKFAAQMKAVLAQTRQTESKPSR